MSAYLIDVVYASVHFLGMGWEWNPSLFPIHIYYFQLWDDSYKEHFYEICEHFLLPLYTLIYK
jgi:hypothetical protein